MTMPVYMSLYLFPFSLPYRAKLDLDAHIKVVLEWKDFVPALDQKNVSSSPLPPHPPPHPCTHMHTQTQTHACMHTRTLTHTHAHTTCAHRHTHTCKHTDIRTHCSMCTRWAFQSMCTRWAFQSRQCCHWLALVSTTMLQQRHVSCYHGNYSMLQWLYGAWTILRASLLAQGLLYEPLIRGSPTVCLCVL